MHHRCLLFSVLSSQGKKNHLYIICLCTVPLSFPPHAYSYIISILVSQEYAGNTPVAFVKYAGKEASQGVKGWCPAQWQCRDAQWTHSQYTSIKAKKLTSHRNRKNITTVNVPHLRQRVAFSTCSAWPFFLGVIDGSHSPLPPASADRRNQHLGGLASFSAFTGTTLCCQAIGKEWAYLIKKGGHVLLNRLCGDRCPV